MTETAPTMEGMDAQGNSMRSSSTMGSRETNRSQETPLSKRRTHKLYQGGEGVGDGGGAVVPSPPPSRQGGGGGGGGGDRQSVSNSNNSTTNVQNNTYETSTSLSSSEHHHHHHHNNHHHATTAAAASNPVRTTISLNNNNNNNGNDSNINDQQQDGQWITIDNFDPTNADGGPVLTSPRSLKACEDLGVPLEDLLKQPLDMFLRTGVDKNTARLRWQMQEQSRQQAVEAVKRQRQKMIARSRPFQLPPPAPPSDRGEGVKMDVSSESLLAAHLALDSVKRREQRDQIELARLQEYERRRLARLLREKLRETDLEESLALSQKEAERQRAAVLEARATVAVQNRLQSQLSATLRLRNLEMEKEEQQRYQMQRQMAKHTAALQRLQFQEKNWRDQASRGKGEAAMMAEWRSAFEKQRKAEQEQLARLQEMTETQRQRVFEERQAIMKKRMQRKQRKRAEKEERQRQMRMEMQRQAEERRDTLEKRMSEHKQIKREADAGEQLRLLEKTRAVREFKEQLLHSVAAVNLAVKNYYISGSLDLSSLPPDVAALAVGEPVGLNMKNTNNSFSSPSSSPPTARSRTTTSHNNTNNSNNKDSSLHPNGSQTFRPSSSAPGIGGLENTGGSGVGATTAGWEDRNGEAVALTRGVAMRSFVAQGQTRYFKVLIANPGVLIKITCKSLDGHVDFFVGNSFCPYPSEANYTWRKDNSSEEPLSINRADWKYSLGYLYIGVTGLTNSFFVVVVNWTDRDRLASARPGVRAPTAIDGVKHRFMSSQVKQLPPELREKALRLLNDWRC